MGCEMIQSLSAWKQIYLGYRPSAVGFHLQSSERSFTDSSSSDAKVGFFFFFWEDIDTRLNSKEHANMLTLMGCHVYHWMGVIQRQRKKSESTPVDFFFFTFTQLESCPVTEAMIRRETRRDPTLSYVYSAIQSCWNTEQRIQFTEFYQCHDKLSLDEGCIMW